MLIKNEYTVTEVAEIFQTNPETIRKWIREGKLNAIPGNSKKEGIRIQDSSIQSFLDKHSRYSKIALTSATAAMITGGLSIPAFLMVRAYKENQALASAIVKSSDMLELLEEEINNEKIAISKIQQDIDSLKKNVKNKEARIDSLQHMIVEIKGSELDKEDGLEHLLSNSSEETIPRKSNANRMKTSRVHTKKSHKENSEENKESKT